MNTERNRKRRMKAKAKRRERLADSDKSGWKQCSPYHYQKMIGGKRVDWWPSTSKCMIENQVYKIFGHDDIMAIVGSMMVRP